MIYPTRPLVRGHTPTPGLLPRNIAEHLEEICRETARLRFVPDSYIRRGNTKNDCTGQHRMAVTLNQTIANVDR